MYIFMFLGEKMRINGEIFYEILIVDWCCCSWEKIARITYSLLWAFADIIIDMREVLAENSTELTEGVSKQRSVSDTCKCYALSTKIAIIHLKVFFHKV